MNRVLITCLASLLATTASAERHNYDDEHTVGVYYGLYTDHLFQPEDRDELNENNDVVVVQYDKWNIGTFENSHYDRSYVVAWEFYGGRYSHKRLYLDGRFAVGGATGYVGETFTVAGIAPSVLINADIGIQHEHVEYGIRGIYTLPNVINTGLFINFKY